MKLITTHILLLIAGFFLCSAISSKAQIAEGFWKDADQSEFPEKCYLESLPSRYRLLELDLPALKAELDKAVYDTDPNAFINGPEILLPLPYGGMGRFKVTRSEVLPANSTPSYDKLIRTFTATGIDDPYAVAKLDYTIFGFHAMIMSPSGWIMIDPYSLKNSSHYISFYRRDRTNASNLICETEDGLSRQLQPYHEQDHSVNRASGQTLKTYRLALACTGEYAAVFGGTQSGALSAMVTSVNRVTGVYESELAVRLILIPNNSVLVYTDAATDPYTNNNGSTMLGQNQTNITTLIGSANYDIGHVFSTGGGGVAGLGVVCNSGNKARGVTGQSNPVGDGFDIDYVAHEMGHQFAGNHTFNGSGGSCGSNRSGSSAYEPGSGTTIMAYAGICGSDNTQSFSDPIFHSRSYQEIQVFITTGTGNTCDAESSTGNAAPVLSLPGNFTIPYLTPFSLTGSGTDPDGDPLTFLWEQYDLGAQAGVNATQTAGSNFPLFRDFTPQTSGTRIFPRINDIVANTQTIGERLPSVARVMTFRFTARDNHMLGGGVRNNDSIPVEVTVVVTPDTFLVKNPNTAITWFTGTSQLVQWDVSGTDASPIHCANVNIYLSSDGGFTYPHLLASGVPNNGSATITVPVVLTSQARVKVEGAGNIFFDISNVNFSIVSGGGILNTITTNPLSSPDLCAGASIQVSFSANGNANPGNVFTAQLSNASGSFTSPVSIGTLTSSIGSGTINCVIPAGTASGTNYLIRVISSSPSVTGSTNGSPLTVHRPVASAGTISGPTSVCAGANGIVYSISALSNATTYLWTLPSGASIVSGSGTNSITVNFNTTASSGSITVSGQNNCFAGGSSSLSVTVNPLQTTGQITATPSDCSGQSATFSVPVNPAAQSYDWILPSGGTITSGAGTNSITAVFTNLGTGTVSVAAVNGCGTGPYSSISYTVNSLSPAISANGPLTFCQGGNVELNVMQVAGSVVNWRNNGSLIPGATAASYTAGTSGIYDVAAAYPVTRSSTGSTFIPDNICSGAASTINVSGYTGTVASSAITIKINITHTYVGDLLLYLLAPTGDTLGLSNGAGGSGDNFTNTIFSDAGATQIPNSSASAPFTGTYKPWSTIITTCASSDVTSFSGIGGGQVNPNGNWRLLVIDKAAQDTGRINNFSITFPATLNGPCIAFSNQLSVNVASGPAITSFSPSSGTAGTSITITGTDFTNATSVLFNGITAAFTVVNSTQINATVPAGNVNGSITVSTPCGSAVSTGTFTSSITLNLKVFIEGFYAGPSIMRSALGGSVCDTIELSLAGSSTPYTILYTSRQTLSTSGNAIFTIPGNFINNSYYLIVRHRNSLETWSGSPIALPSLTNSFDFSLGASQAYGSNLTLVSAGKWAIRSGDINQDDIINHTDYVSVQNALAGWLSLYQVNDLTGDNFVESTDYSLVETNSKLNLQIKRP